MVLLAVSCVVSGAVQQVAPAVALTTGAGPIAAHDEPHESVTHVQPGEPGQRRAVRVARLTRRLRVALRRLATLAGRARVTPARAVNRWHAPPPAWSGPSILLT